MATPMTTSLSSTGISQVVPLDLNITPINVGLAVTFSPGAVMTYTVEHTYNKITDQASIAAATWFPFLSNVQTSADGFYAYPVVAVRFRVTAYTSGTATLRVVQAGI